MDGRPDSPNRTRRAGSGFYIGLLLCAALLIIGYNLGANSLHNQDEARHAVVAREAALDGHWLPLTYGGRPYYNKPPLRIWLTALAFRVAGISEWTVRFWSAASAVATILVIFLMASRIYGVRAAFFAALALLTSHQYLYNHCARSGETDAMLILFLTGGLLTLQLAVIRRRLGLLLAAAALTGLCGITKHLGFVPIVLIIAVAWVLLSRSWSSFTLRQWCLALAVVLGVALPWHLTMWWVQGEGFLRGYFLREVVERRLEASTGGQSRARLGHWISIATFAKGFFPWSALIPAALLSWPNGRRERERQLLPLIWLLTMLATTVISSQKFTWYVLPAFPAAALLVGTVVDRFLARATASWIDWAVLFGSLAAFASLTNAATKDPFGSMARQTMLSVWFLGRLASQDSASTGPMWRWIASALLLGLAYWTLGRWRRGPQLQRNLRRLCVALLTALALYTVVVPLRFSRQQSPIHEMAELVETTSDGLERVYVSLAGRKAYNPLFRFYMGDLDFQRFEPDRADAVDLTGKLLLTDMATIPRLTWALPDLESHGQTLGRARGLTLLRVPEDSRDSNDESDGS